MQNRSGNYFGAQIENAEIADGTITNAKINSSAAIAESKLAFSTTTGHNHDGVGSRAIIAGVSFLASTQVNVTSSNPTDDFISLSIGAGDLTAKDFLVIELVSENGATPCNMGFKIGVGTTYTAGLSLGSTGTAQASARFIISQSQETNTTACVEGILSAAGTLAGSSSTLTGLSANWITGAFTLKIKGNYSASGGETAFLKVIVSRIKGQ